MTYLPANTPTSTEIGLITGYTGNYSASGTLLSYETHYYTVPFFVWVVIGSITLFLFSRIIKEFLKRWQK